MPEIEKTVLFISHTSADRPHALALEELIYDLVLNRGQIEVRSSSGEDTGPQGGETWREWIYRAVNDANATLIVVTPHALGKPWLLWEAGAVKGVSLARSKLPSAPPEDAQGPMIFSLAYGLPLSECPDPLRGEQIILGTDLTGLKELFRRMFQNLGLEGSTENRTRTAFNRYAQTVRIAMQRTPSLINEANVQDWLDRLDALVTGKRLSELDGFERSMMLTFGRDPKDVERSGDIPIDVRLHRSIGELYRQQKRYGDAVRQLRLAWRAAPRDIYVLRPLAEAGIKRLLGDKQADEASAREEINSVLEYIREIDENAYVASPEAAGLLGRYHRRVLRDARKALEIYKESFSVNPKSYYLADLIAQTELELDLSEAARASFVRALNIIEQLGERNIWSQATAATACVALGRGDQAREHLRRIREIGPLGASDFDSIAGGIREVAEKLNIAAEEVDELLGILKAPGDRAM